jgi:signal transduction histidine kinase
MREALFMGRLTAQATHELQNILATIRESGGLMDDLLAIGGEGFAHAERFKKGLGVLAEQVERGMALTEQLNFCAHAPEPTAAGAEVNDSLRSLVGLFRRIAARCRVNLVLAPGRTGLRTALLPVELMELVGAAIDCALPLMPRDSQLMLSVEEQGGLSVVRLDAPSHEALQSRPEQAALRDCAKALGAGLCPGPGGQGLVLSLPKARA